MDLHFAPASVLDEPGAGLLAAMVAEMIELYGLPAGSAVGVPLHPEELGPPAGVYLVGWVGDLSVAGGGLRGIDDGVAEIKRMYVRPGYRGHGIGRLLLAALEQEAVRLGYHTARLDTGAKQPGPQRMYEQAGYRSIGNYNANPHAAFWGEKRLA
jgi:GNAT superfamily N-acetyltransferase